MNTPLSNAQSQGPQLEQLHRDVAAFTEEMRQAQSVASANRRPAMLSFVLGAATAIATFAAAVALLHL